MNLYTLVYKSKQMVRQGLIEASSLEAADKLGREYCMEGSQRRYISVVDAILVREKVEPLKTGFDVLQKDLSSVRTVEQVKMGIR
jgi:hypothetical protein